MFLYASAGYIITKKRIVPIVSVVPMVPDSKQGVQIVQAVQPLRSAQVANSKPAKKGKPTMRFSAAISLSLSALSIVCSLPGSALAQAPYYEGKTITVVGARSAGGAGDLKVRTLYPFLRKYIPGNPTIVSEYMPGGGGRQAANHLYHKVRRDGLTIGSLSSTLPEFAILGSSGVLYDIDKFIYLGAISTTSHYVFLTRKEAGLDTVEKLRKASGVRIATNPVGHSVYVTARLFVYVLGLKAPNIIPGYPGPEGDVAMMRGEVDARVNIANALVQRRLDWLEKDLVNLHTIIKSPIDSPPLHPRLGKLPELGTLSESARDRRLLAMYRGFRQVGMPFVLPPDTPKEQTEILKEAMRKALSDPEFKKDYERLTREDPAPFASEEITKVIRELPRDAEVVELYNLITGAAPLPAR